MRKYYNGKILEPGRSAKETSEIQHLNACLDSWKTDDGQRLLVFSRLVSYGCFCFLLAAVFLDGDNDIRHQNYVCCGNSRYCGVCTIP